MSPAKHIHCPVCGNTVATEPRTPDFPFCSSTCKTIDLGRWLDQRYAVDMRTGKLDLVDETDDEDEEDDTQVRTLH